MAAEMTELEEIKQLQATAELKGYSVNSRWYKKHMKCIEVRHMKLAMQAAGMGAGSQQIRGRRTTYSWGTEADGLI